MAPIDVGSVLHWLCVTRRRLVSFHVVALTQAGTLSEEYRFFIFIHYYSDNYAIAKITEY